MKILLNFEDEKVIKDNQKLLNKIIYKYKINILDIFYNTNKEEQIKFNYKQYIVKFKNEKQIDLLFEDFIKNNDKQILKRLIK